MSGTFHFVERMRPMDEVGPYDDTVKTFLNGLLWGTRWAGSEITYAFPDSRSEYAYTPDDTSPGTDRVKVAHRQVLREFEPITAQQETAVAFALDADVGPKASAAFAVEGFTRLNVSEQTSSGNEQPAHLRFANTGSEKLGTAMVADFPGGLITPTAEDDGDIWFGPSYSGYREPEAGNFGWFTHLHETGHGLGLKHPHDKAGWIKTVAEEWDWVEYSVMSYRNYEGEDPFADNRIEGWSSPQTFMMGDIAALQYLYGANYDINAGDTVYSWSPSSGETLVDGEVAIRPGGNRIFATIWDGGGTDTYDLSAYRSDLSLDLRPARFSHFRDRQLAELDEGYDIRARGNIYNAALHEGDTASRIENAIGGRGNDLIVGNAARNVLTGSEGQDELWGLRGSDTFRYAGDVDRADGADVLYGDKGFDHILLEGDGRYDLSSLSARSVEAIRFATGADEDKRLILSTATLETSRGFDDMIVVGNEAADSSDTLVLRVQSEADADVSLQGWEFRNWENGAERIVLRGDGEANMIRGSAEADRIDGKAGRDVLFGHAGQDGLEGGGGADRLRGGTGDDTLEGGRGADLLFGGKGQDTFCFADVADSTPDAMDVVLDFDPRTDRIDLSVLDARVGSAHDDSFVFLGLASAREVRKAGPGALWLEEDEAGSGTMLMCNVDRNVGANLIVLLEDGRRAAGSYDEDVFVL
ncbi:M10 family metallopeptidase [uncultured Jannaschia sp.]|uniref:M10 family metallopeptidase n=1 Tax=uncultured Jannaschia sp. TaxID=293347 RepID=UPI002632C597|nr:M10 family metallopeptidase [uncultured Jannaschia sp.]